MAKVCPFCKYPLPKHHHQCFHGEIPAGQKVAEQTEKKRVNDIKKLMDSLTDPNKIVLDGPGGDLKKRYGGK